MKRRFMFVSVLFVGSHSLLVSTLAIVGVSDEDPTFLLGLLISFLDRPALWVLGPSPDPVGIFLAGTVQWLLIALPVAALLHGIAQWRGRAAAGESVEDRPRH